VAVAAPFRRAGSLAALLAGVTFLDELATGVPFAGSPEVQGEFDVSYGQAAGWLLAAAGLLALVLEPPLFLLADRRSRRPFVVGGLFAVAATCALGAWAPSYPWLFAAILLYGPASGVACGCAQATLMDAHPAQRERWMVRWTLSGELGDLAAPALVAISVALGASYRLGLAAAGGLFALWALLLWRAPFPARAAEAASDGAGASESVADPPFGAALRAALRRREVWLWAVAALLCDLLDEIVVAFGALHLRDGLGLGAAPRAAILGAGVAGGAFGLLAAERLLARFDARRLLLAACAACAVCYALWLRAESAFASGALFAATGAFAALHYPIAQAQLYRAVPESSGSVNALSTALGALAIPLPLLLGVAADRAGLGFALALLLAQPLGVAAAALIALRARR
jgi:predicted MFS family arabinose efflux permease